MKYKIKDCDPGTGQSDDDQDGYSDESVLGNIEVTMSDHMQKVLKTNWSTSWDEIGVENEFQDHFTLSLLTLEECVKKISSCMEMQPCEQSEQVAEEKKSHILYLAGIYRGGHDVLVRAQMALEGTSAASSAATISMGLKIRSSNQSVVQAIAAYVYKQNFF